MTTAAQLALLRQPWQERRGRHALRSTFTVLLMLALPAALVGLRMGLGPLQLAGVLGAVGVAWLWWMQVDGLLRQNRPELARLLPGQLRALHLSLRVQAGLALAAGFGCLSLAFGPRAEWLWLGAVTLLMLAWLRHEPWLWLPLGLWPLLPASIGVRPLLQGLMAQPLAVQALMFAAMALALDAVLGDGCGRHRRRDARVKRWQAALREEQDGRPTPAEALGLLPRWLARAFGWPQRAQRRWLLRRPGPATALPRLDMGLQAGGLVPALLWLVVLMAGGLGIAAAVVAQVVTGTDWVQVIDRSLAGLCIGVFSLLCSPLSARAPALWGRRREQALLVLLPGPPAGPALTQALEARWRREHLQLWVLGTAIVLSVGSLGSAEGHAFAATFAACCLPLSWWAQHRHRKLTAMPPAFGLWMVAPALATAPAWWAQQAGVPGWASLAAGAAMYALCATASSAPGQALLPAGR